MLYALINRPLLELNVLHDRNPLFVQLSSGDIRNGYDIKILNKTHNNHSYRLDVEGLEGAQISMVGAGNLDAQEISVAADSVGQNKVFIQAPVNKQEPIVITFIIKDIHSGLSAKYRTMFISRKPHG